MRRVVQAQSGLRTRDARGKVIVKDSVRIRLPRSNGGMCNLACPMRMCICFLLGQGRHKVPAGPGDVTCFPGAVFVRQGSHSDLIDCLIPIHKTINPQCMC